MYVYSGNYNWKKRGKVEQRLLAKQESDNIDCSLNNWHPIKIQIKKSNIV
jgi:hypothetical protein